MLAVVGGEVGAAPTEGHPQRRAHDDGSHAGRNLCCPDVRRRLRELGHAVGRFPTGERNALVDVPGVLVGHRTMVEGDRLRTGVTAILPHAGQPLRREGARRLSHDQRLRQGGRALPARRARDDREPAAADLHAVGRPGAGRAACATCSTSNPEAAVDRDTVNVIVAECFDGWLSDARALAVRPEHALEAIAAAAARRGRRGRGRRRDRHDAASATRPGIGGASRRTDGARAGLPGVLQLRGRRDLHLLVGPASRGPDVPEPPGAGGSIVIVARHATPRSRSASCAAWPARATFGLGRAGGFGANASGEYALAFSTAQRIPHRERRRPARAATSCATTRSPLRELFEATAEVVHEAVLNSLCAAERDGGPRRQPRRGAALRAAGAGARPAAAELSGGRGAPQGPLASPHDGASVRRHALDEIGST